MPANTLDNFWNKVNKTNNCWEWQGCVDNDGYGRIQINKVRWKTHRLSYHIHKGNIPSNLVVCHSCDNPKCVNPDHLWLGTQIQNTQDRDQKGRHRISPSLGESNGSSRFTNEQIEFIRTSSLSGRELSRQFNVSDNAIYNIRLRKTWKHI
jgi:hypothetical protein